MTTTRVDIPVLEGDDIDFIHLVRSTLGTQLTVATDDTYLVKVDHWFGKRFLLFEGKRLGAFGVGGGRRTTLPPFHPSRIVFERHFTTDPRSGAWVEATPVPPLHIRQTSEQNFKRFVDDVSKSGTFIWYSGDTREMGRGSLMVYLVAANERNEWHVEMIRGASGWRAAQSTGLTYPEAERRRALAG